MPSPWTIASASVEGTSHLASSSPCQDSADVLIIHRGDEDFLLVAASDGAGTAAQSGVASRRAVERFVALAREFLEAGGCVQGLTRDSVLHWLHIVRDELATFAHDRQHVLDDYACTLLGAIVGEDSAAFVQVGDGAMVVACGLDGGWRPVTWPQHGEYANVTTFVTSPDMPVIAEFVLLENRVNDLAMFTDGLESLVLHSATRTPHQPFFNLVFAPLHMSGIAGVDSDLSDGLATFLASSMVCDRTDDDKTLLLATRGGR